MHVHIYVINALLVITLGVLLHFTHPWIKKGFLTHVISAINESTWEHLKLAFWPMLGGIITRGIFATPKSPIYWASNFLSVLTALILIPALYYPIRVLLKKELTAISISIYFIASTLQVQ